jgi:hypothetical protein
MALGLHNRKGGLPAAELGFGSEPILFRRAIGTPPCFPEYARRAILLCSCGVIWTSAGTSAAGALVIFLAADRMVLPPSVGVYLPRPLGGGRLPEVLAPCDSVEPGTKNDEEAETASRIYFQCSSKKPEVTTSWLFRVIKA